MNLLRGGKSIRLNVSRRRERRRSCGTATKQFVALKAFLDHCVNELLLLHGTTYAWTFGRMDGWRPRPDPPSSPPPPLLYPPPGARKGGPGDQGLRIWAPLLLLCLAPTTIPPRRAAQETPKRSKTPISQGSKTPISQKRGWRSGRKLFRIQLRLSAGVAPSVTYALALPCLLYHVGVQHIFQI